MSHTTRIGETVFIHNGDYSGDVEILRGVQQIAIPFLHLRDFIAGYVLYKRQLWMEDATSDEILGLPKE